MVRVYFHFDEYFVVNSRKPTETEKKRLNVVGSTKEANLLKKKGDSFAKQPGAARTADQWDKEMEEELFTLLREAKQKGIAAEKAKREEEPVALSQEASSDKKQQEKMKEIEELKKREELRKEKELKRREELRKEEEQKKPKKLKRAYGFTDVVNFREASAFGHLFTTNQAFQNILAYLWGHRARLHYRVVGTDKMNVYYKSCSLAAGVLWAQIELEDALHWLSTLGGAYSNLGENSADFAVKAGENALSQMSIALRSPDPTVKLRCWLHVAMSLMQQGRLRRAKHLVRAVHARCAHAIERNRAADQGDHKKVRNSCLGIWSRLKFAYAERSRRRA